MASRAVHTLPATGDHAWNAAAARSLFKSDPRALEWRRNAYITTGLPVLFPVAVSMRAVAPSLAVSRVTMLVLNAFLLAAFLVALVRLGPAGRLAAAGFLILAVPISLHRFHTALWDSVMGDLPAFFLTGTALCLAAAARRRSTMGASGFLLGLAAATKLSAAFAVAPAAFVVVWAARRHPSRRAARAALAFGAGLASAAALAALGRLLASGGWEPFREHVAAFFAFAGDSSGFSRAPHVGLYRLQQRCGVLIALFGGPVLAPLIALAATSCVFWRQAPAERPSAAGLFLLCAAPGLAHWIMLDPFGYANRLLGPLLLAVTGVLLAAGRCPSAAAKGTFLALAVAAGYMNLWGAAAPRFPIVREPSPELRDAVEASQALDAMIAEGRVERLAGNGWKEIATLEAIRGNFPSELLTGWDQQRPWTPEPADQGPIDPVTRRRLSDWRPESPWTYVRMKGGRSHPATSCAEPAILFKNATFEIGRCGDPA